MSDFDKEAEREKLREKYERDKADREATQRMSDLLLKGATMTNTHCGVCGDPFFRQDGTTFCPTCHGSPDAVDGPVQQAEGGGTESGTAGETPDETPAGADADSPAETGTDNVATTDATTDADSRADPSTADSSATSIDVSTPSGESHSAEPDESPSESETPSPSPSPSSAGDDTAARSTADATPTDATNARATGNSANTTQPSRSSPAAPSRSVTDVSSEAPDAQSTLTQTLEYFSQEAATTDDPRYAKECLEAAREAAETLAALRRGR